MHAFFIDALYGMSQSAIDISFNAIIYDRSGKRNIVGTIVRREIFVYTGGGLVFFIMYFVTNLRLGFVLTGLDSLLHFLF
jgi:hypothetical protein